jgi:uncharacterized membrane protein YphA (DoxX/SURF4 family)
MRSKYDSLISFLLRAGIATVFLYAAIAAFLDPFSWIGFFPVWLRELFDAELLLMGFSIFEIALSLWIFSGAMIREAAIVASITLFAIVLGNLGALDIVFRDVAILFAALALVAIGQKDKETGHGI